MITVVLPELIPAKWWQHVLHNQRSLLLKGSLLFKKGVIVNERSVSFGPVKPSSSCPHVAVL